MEKIKIKSMKKDSLRSEFIFEKNESAVDAINEILNKLGFSDAPSHNLKDLIYDERTSGSEFKIDEAVDEVYGMENDNYFVNVFIGNTKIFLVVNSIADKQKEVSEAVFEFADFEEEDKDGN